MWKKQASKVILSHPRLTVVEDTVELPDGSITDYVSFKNDSNFATILCQNDEGKFLLQKEYSYPPNTELYQLPGGAVHSGEDAMTGASRELSEEEGIKAQTFILLGSYYINNRKTDAKNYIFLATNLEQGITQRDIEERNQNLQSFWFAEAEIEDLMRNGDIQHSAVLAAWTLYKLKKGA